MRNRRYAEVFTTRPDTVYGVTFMVLAPEHPLVDAHDAGPRAESRPTSSARRKSEIERLSTTSREKTGVFTGAYVTNPFNDERIPIWIADYVLMGYGTGAIMGVPGHDQRDFEFARGLRSADSCRRPARERARPGSGDDDRGLPRPGILVNSGPMTGKRVPDGVADGIAWLQETGRGEAEVNYRLRDWLISRQRYWGTPIPVVYCDLLRHGAGARKISCRCTAARRRIHPHRSIAAGHRTRRSCIQPARSVVVRPDAKPTPWTPSSTRPGIGSATRRPQEDREAVDPAAALAGLPVDLYCGGIEHAILHLLLRPLLHQGDARPGTDRPGRALPTTA